MKYVKMICLTVVALITLASCDNDGGNSTPAIKDVKNISPNITRYGYFSSVSESFVYLVDNNTGVVYLEYDSAKRHAISVMLNADGTPVTAEQIGLK